MIRTFAALTIISIAILAMVALLIPEYLMVSSIFACGFILSLLVLSWLGRKLLNVLGYYYPSEIKGIDLEWQKRHGYLTSNYSGFCAQKSNIRCLGMLSGTSQRWKVEKIEKSSGVTFGIKNSAYNLINETIKSLGDNDGFFYWIRPVVDSSIHGFIASHHESNHNALKLIWSYTSEPDNVKTKKLSRVKSSNERWVEETRLNFSKIDSLSAVPLVAEFIIVRGVVTFLDFTVQLNLEGEDNKLLQKLRFQKYTKFGDYHLSNLGRSILYEITSGRYIPTSDEILKISPVEESKLDNDALYIADKIIDYHNSMEFVNAELSSVINTIKECLAEISIYSPQNEEASEFIQEHIREKFSGLDCPWDIASSENVLNRNFDPSLSVFEQILSFALVVIREKIQLSGLVKSGHHFNIQELADLTLPALTAGKSSIIDHVSDSFVTIDSFSSMPKDERANTVVVALSAPEQFAQTLSSECKGIVLKFADLRSDVVLNAIKKGVLLLVGKDYYEESIKKANKG